MKKKILFLLLISFLFLQKNFSQDTTNITGPLSLKECVEIALKNNLQVNTSELLMEDSRVNLSLARGYQLPFVSGKYQSWR
jgi:hypothetical protein